MRREGLIEDWRRYLSTLPNGRLKQHLQFDIKETSVYQLFSGAPNNRIKRFAKTVRAFEDSRMRRIYLKDSGNILFAFLSLAQRQAESTRSGRLRTLEEALGLKMEKDNLPGGHDPGLPVPIPRGNSRTCQWCPACILKKISNNVTKFCMKRNDELQAELTCPPTNTPPLLDIRCAVCINRLERNRGLKEQQKVCHRYHCWDNSSTKSTTWLKAATLGLLDWDRYEVRSMTDSHSILPKRSRVQEAKDMSIINHIRLYCKISEISSDLRYELDTMWMIAKYRGWIDLKLPIDPHRRVQREPPLKQERKKRTRRRKRVIPAEKF